MSDISDPLIEVSLEQDTSGGRNVYSLRVHDESGKARDRLLFVADLTHSTGGFTLDRWRINRLARRPILSAFLFVNLLGHDLDQWVHYDLETSEKLDRERAARIEEDMRHQSPGAPPVDHPIRSRRWSQAAMSSCGAAGRNHAGARSNSNVTVIPCPH